MTGDVQALYERSEKLQEDIRNLLLEADEPFDRTAHPRSGLWCILRDPVVRHGLKTIDPLVWTTIPCQRMNGEPILFLRQTTHLTPVYFTQLWNRQLSDRQRAVLWLSVDSKNERRLASLLADNPKEIARTLKEIGTPPLDAIMTSSPHKELIDA